MKKLRLPSADVPDSEKRTFSEADVHSKLFDPDMVARGYPPRGAPQAAGEYFSEQQTLALRRLKSQHAHAGRFDGLYLIGNSPVVLCELKRYDGIDGEQNWQKAKRQLQDYALSDDFDEKPPYLILYCGKPERDRFFVRRTDASGAVAYDEQEEIWTWSRVRDSQAKGAFAPEIVDATRLREILLFHLDRIEDSLRTQVAQAVQVAKTDQPPPLLGDFGKWLLDRPEALARMRLLYQRKVAELGTDKDEQVAGEMVTQAALNYLNKVFFLELCEDRHLPGFYRIMREFLPRSRADTTSSGVAVFLGLLRRRIKDTSATWDPEDELAYKSLRNELAPAIRDRVIDQNSWRELIQVAFDLASERFPLVYREDAYDYFRPSREALAELIYDLSTKSFEQLSNRHVGDIYQSLLSARREQQSKLGAFYTPHGDVEYMVSRLNLTADSKVLDPCMGSGHFLEVLADQLLGLYAQQGVSHDDAYRQIVSSQLFGADIDPFALSLAAIRLFLLSDEDEENVKPHLYVHDMLLHSPDRKALFTDAESVVGIDADVDEPGDVDSVSSMRWLGTRRTGRASRNRRRRSTADSTARRDRS
jgi:hypothetical protein